MPSSGLPSTVAAAEISTRRFDTARPRRWLRAKLAAAKNRLAGMAAEIPLLKSVVGSTKDAIVTRKKRAAVEDLRRCCGR
uniref:Uncharacterized protein n=1 Tax=Oryza meridionalis TaxID=40149 RepID=A0A0E0EQ53_9ORYZ